MALRDLVARQQALVVDDRERLVGRAEGLVLPHRPARQAGDLGRRVGERAAFAGELDLQVHRRAPQHVGRAGVGRLLADEAVVDLGRVHVVVLDRDAGIERLEVLDQEVGRGRVGGAVDDDLAFLLGGGDGVGVGRRIAGGNLGEAAAASERQRGADDDLAELSHVVLSCLRSGRTRSDGPERADYRVPSGCRNRPNPDLQSALPTAVRHVRRRAGGERAPALRSRALVGVGAGGAVSQPCRWRMAIAGQRGDPFVLVVEARRRSRTALPPAARKAARASWSISSSVSRQSDVKPGQKHVDPARRPLARARPASARCRAAATRPGRSGSGR